MIIRTKVRQWGSSYGVIIPSDIVKKEKIGLGDEITLDLHRENPLRKVFGKINGKKIDSQKVKEELRKEWSNW